MPTPQTWPQGKMEMRCDLLGSMQICELVSSEEVSETQRWLKPFLVILFLPGHFKNVVSQLYIHSALARFTDTGMAPFWKSCLSRGPSALALQFFYYLDHLCMQPPVSALWTYVNVTSAICNLFISRLGFLRDSYVICVLQMSMSSSPVVA